EELHRDRHRGRRTFQGAARRPDRPAHAAGESEGMMTPKWREADSEMVGRTLCDIAQVLESSEGAEARVAGAIELLGKLVPYQQCALLEAEPGADPRLTALPALPPEEKNGLTVALVQLHGQMLEERALDLEPPRIMWGAHLAVPLIGLDEVIGVLFVRRGDGHDEKRHLRVLSLVAGQPAACRV